MEILEHFQLKELPFELTPNLNFYCGFKTHANVIESAQYCIEKGESLIKIIGEVGTGKTLLCRKLIEYVDEREYISLYMPNPSLGSDTLLRLVSDELNIDSSPATTEYELYKRITEKLIGYYHQDKKVVLFIDEAHTMNTTSLEAVRLLTNLESEKSKLIQIVLFGQPELDKTLEQHDLRQFRQRISFDCQLDKLNKSEISNYISKRLVSAGYEGGTMFDNKACKLLYKSSLGVPRVINILAYKAMLSSYVAGDYVVNGNAVKNAVKDSRGIVDTVKWSINRSHGPLITGIALLLLAGVLTYFIKGI